MQNNTQQGKHSTYSAAVTVIQTGPSRTYNKSRMQKRRGGGGVKAEGSGGNQVHNTQTTTHKRKLENFFP